jgi:hypothetical protein
MRKGAMGLGQHDGLIPPAASIGLLMALGALAQFVLVAHGADLMTAHFTGPEIAMTPGQTLSDIRWRGRIAVGVAALPFAVAAAVLVVYRLWGCDWSSALKKAAVWMARSDVLVMGYAVFF